MFGQKADIKILSQDRLSSAPCIEFSSVNVRVYGLSGCSSATGFPVVSTTGPLFSTNSL